MLSACGTTEPWRKAGLPESALYEELTETQAF